MKCAQCGKGVMYGHNVSHSKRRTRKIFKPNLHMTRVHLGGISKRVRLCTKCQRIVKEMMLDERAAKAKSTESAPVQASA